MIRVELVKLFRRPRTWLAIGMLVALPVVVAIFISATGIAPRPGTGPAFLAGVIRNGSLFPAAALAVVLPIFLPASVAVIAGDSIAGEATSGTLRYLLARPVGRTRLLVAKLVAIIAFIAAAVILVALVGYVVGYFAFGHAPLSSLSGGPVLSPAQIAERIVASVAYIGLSMVGVAAVALFFSTLTDSGLAAALGAIAVLIASTVLIALDATSTIQPYLLTRYWLAFVDLFRTPVLWHDIVRGVGVQVVYTAVALAAAWANFTTKDITS
jgi:ABC-2 type transport system permease protein